MLLLLVLLFLLTLLSVLLDAAANDVLWLGPRDLYCLGNSRAKPLTCTTVSSVPTTHQRHQHLQHMLAPAPTSTSLACQVRVGELLLVEVVLAWLAVC